jgi:TetR/AcrR family transcriptional regulator, cholesterol catabolism regulator
VHLREKIIEKASKLFFKFGIRSVTMDELSKELGISKKTLYQHFTDKDSLVHEMVKADICCEMEFWESINTRNLNALEKLVEVAHLLTKMFSEVNSTVINDLTKYHSNAWEYIEKHKTEFVIPTIIKDLKQGIDEGLFREDINTKELAHYRYGQVIMAFDQSIFPKEEFNLTQLQMTMLDLFIRSILTEKGLNIYKKIQIPTK